MGLVSENRTRTKNISYVGWGSLILFFGITGLGVSMNVNPKVLIVGWVAFFAMSVAAGVAILTQSNKSGTGAEHARRLVWGYGLSSGAMITSAAVFLVPPALGYHPQIGGFGIAFGVLAGFSAHTVGHRASHKDLGLPFDYTVMALTAHTVTAGLILGLVYTIPEVSLVLGLAIVSHKGPAGYAAATRLANRDVNISSILLPATGVGITAVISNLVGFSGTDLVNAAVFGFASGIFLHVAMDFLPRCELGSEVYEVANISGDAHHLLDKLRVHAVASTTLGAVSVFGAWYFLV